MNAFESQCLSVTHAGEDFLLHPERVMYWPAERTLFAADVHVGKEHVFARHGIAIPGGISESTLQRLFKLAALSEARKLIVLGDFMHHVPNANENWLDQLSALLDQHSSLTLDIVAGNHDKTIGQKRIDPRVTWHRAPLLVAGLALHHEPCKDTKGYVLCGHLHPAYRIGSARRSGIRAPVFWFREDYAVLPAFGEFTGAVTIQPDERSDSLYMTGPDCVVKVPVVARKARLRI